MCVLSLPHYSYLFFFHSSGALRDLHSFPTRRSSDLSDMLRKVDMMSMRASIEVRVPMLDEELVDRKSTHLNSSHPSISYAVFCLKKKKKNNKNVDSQRQIS